MKILALESSCDESAVALFDSEHGIVCERVNTQIALHSQFGGVVPDLASREHLSNFPLLIEGIAREIDPASVDAVAVTRGPGLAGCLALGIAYAKTIALAWEKPMLALNHLRGHLFSPFIPLHEKNPEEFDEACKKLFPHLGLVVSGGNTLLVEVDAERRVKILAGTVDDAAGEAFDKGAKLLGMPYPGGALIEKHAASAKERGSFVFPHGEAIKREPRFSFSGLKTSLRYRLEKMTDKELATSLPEICADYQEAIIRQLTDKVAVQFEKKRYASIGLSGGVSNNKTLRAAFEKLAARKKVPIMFAKPKHTGDNAAMMAFAAWFDKQLSLPEYSKKITFEPALTIENP